MTQVGHPQTAQLSGRPEGSAAEKVAAFVLAELAF